MKKILFALLLCSISFAEESKEIARNRATKRDYTSKHSFEKERNEFLFILHAKDGHIAMDTKGGYFLTLYGVSKNVTYFSERPNRKAGRVSTEQFLSNWSKGENSFRKDEPNAGIVTYSQTLGPVRYSDFPVILKNPHYEEDANRATFDIKRLEVGETIPTGDLGEITLFVDGNVPLVNGQITD